MPLPTGSPFPFTYLNDPSTSASLATSIASPAPLGTTDSIATAAFTTVA